jgi:carbon monoxide dehydrogenase subunit G
MRNHCRKLGSDEGVLDSQTVSDIVVPTGDRNDAVWPRQTRSFAQMEISGQHRFLAPRERVWELLLDPKILQQCLPGAEDLVEVGPEEYEARMKIGVAAIRGTYQGRVKIVEKDEPNSYRMAVEGKGPAGQISGDAKIDLAEDGEGTLVNWAGNANVRGTLARVGGRVMQPAAKMIVGQFFTCLEGKASS